ncbi:30S ribosomal protein S18 [Gordonia effusa NBRC 100432]|uniref:Small ribosomal subunit protein bS18 n=1 Tax=Gordonia effusa NBRC 100432 TaxID=1077974 RepID=H0QUS1_9ACTN|nr:30S ribosomal protein S18 [Gordonia effusa]GAB16572.1 30S ribosomal protein S18 [Gordonia effusa NBRC 100432]
MGTKRPLRPAAPTKPRPNPLAGRTEPVSYHDVALLRQFLSDNGKIRSRRVTGLSPQQQRQVATAIRNAREMALLPFGKVGKSGG